MTTKTQAEILVDEYYQLIGEHIFNGHFDLAKDCALIALNLLIEHLQPEFHIDGTKNYDTIEYFEKVKQEIEKL